MSFSVVSGLFTVSGLFLRRRIISRFEVDFDDLMESLTSIVGNKSAFIGLMGVFSSRDLFFCAFCFNFSIWLEKLWFNSKIFYNRKNYSKYNNYKFFKFYVSTFSASFSSFSVFLLNSFDKLLYDLLYFSSSMFIGEKRLGSKNRNIWIFLFTSIISN